MNVMYCSDYDIFENISIHFGGDVNYVALNNQHQMIKNQRVFQRQCAVIDKIRQPANGLFFNGSLL